MDEVFLLIYGGVNDFRVRKNRVFVWVKCWMGNPSLVLNRERHVTGEERVGQRFIGACRESARL
jgi:hypothetical protein